MKRAIAFMAVSLCAGMASAMAAPVKPGQQGAAVARNNRAAVRTSGRKLLQSDGGSGYNFDWQPYSTYDDEVYGAAEFIIKVLIKEENLLKTLFGDSYQEGYMPAYVNIPQAYYYVDYDHNKFYSLSLYIEYYGQFYYIDFIVFAPYRENHYTPEYLYEIIISNNYLKGSWSA